MSKKEEAKTQETQETKKSTGDNLMNDLKSFNEGSTESEQAVEANEESKEEVKTEESQDKWLIENKFSNDEEGVKNLANAYKELQSKSDKDRNEYKSKMKGYEQFEQLDEILSNNPSVVEAMQNELKRLSKKENMPEKPEDYDILDETVEGTSSYGWRQDYDKYLVNMGRDAAKEEVNTLREEMKRKETTQKRVAKLSNMGLNREEIKEYYSFMTDKQNLTDENLVPIWQHLSGKKNFTTSSQNEPQVIPEPKRVSAAAVEGKAPAAKPDSEKAKDEFWAGIMKSARKV